MQGSYTWTTAAPQVAVRVLSNMDRLPDRCGPHILDIELFPSNPVGVMRKVGTAINLYLKGFGRDVIFFNQPEGLLFLLCALRTILPLGRARIIVFDIILPKPDQRLSARLVAWIKSLLLKRISLFILHLKEPGELERCYGISRSKSVFVPFKVNSLERLSDIDTTDRGYILAPGKSWRDYRTFCEAMAQVSYPAKILVPRSESECARHGTTSLDGAPLPSNVEVVNDDGSAASWMRFIAGARLVVVPISPDAISAAGNGTYILALAMGKCLVITDCPGARGILEDGKHALIVPQQNPKALAAVIRRAWENDDLRRQVGEGGKAYALTLGGEQRLHNDLIREVIRYLERQGRLRHGS